jgi:nucleoside 2-deoxyribosyltransferase
VTTTNKKIYLACPYSHKDPKVRKDRFERVNALAAKLMAKGFLVFSPISHTHPIAEAGDLPKGWEYWKNYDESFLDWCDEVFVYKLEGWTVSTGVMAEIEIAKQLGKPITYIRQYDVAFLEGNNA